jgi:2'-5' RNA ligase
MPAPESRTQAQSVIRTFLAIELPDSVRTRLAGIEREFSRSMSGLKWSGPDLLHITLRFLGGVPQNRMVPVMDVARDAAAGTRPFQLTLSGLGAFPTVRKPRVIWVGLEKDAGYLVLQQLFAHIEAGLVADGFPPEERAYSPHITLARTRDTIAELERRELGTTLAEVASRVNLAGTVPVRKVTVMQSELSRSGPRYTPLARYPLVGVTDDERGTV